jgi:ribosomal-protein-alanine N-acetyltransferase
MTLVVRAAGADDSPAVARLEQEALGRDAWSATLLAEALSGGIPTLLCLVAEVDGAPVGYAAVSLVADVAELQRIAVASAHRRTGVATALLDGVAQEAVSHHCDRIVLEVRDDNAGALGFYAHHGFTELDRRPRYYADGTTAIVLARDVGTMAR